MASSRLSQTTRATDRADHLHGEPSMAPRSERCAVSLSAPRPLTTFGASRSTGPFDEVRRVYGDFATALECHRVDERQPGGPTRMVWFEMVIDDISAHLRVAAECATQGRPMG